VPLTKSRRDISGSGGVPLFFFTIEYSCLFVGSLIYRCA
jgi:hypothetical protein